MATFQFEGVDKLIQQYQKLEVDTEKVIGSAIYEGTAVVMGAIKSAIDGIQTDDSHGFGTAENPKIGPTSIQKAGLWHSVGIAKMRNDNGFWNTKIGFDGYNYVKTKRWPQGQPNAMVARSIESGTSWMKKQPFMRKAEQSARSRCEKVMREEVDRKVKELMGE